MKLYISARGIKKLTLAEDDGGGGRGESEFGGKMKDKKGSLSAGVGRRLFCRSVMLSVLLIMSLFLSSILIRIAFLAFDSAASCSSSLDCLAWKILGGNDAALLRDELTKALADTTNMVDTGKTVDGKTFNDLVTDMTSTKHDIKTFAFIAKTVMVRMEQRLQSAKRHEKMNWHLASNSVPKNIQCLSLLLAEEYAINSMARSHLPSPELAYRLTDPSFHHIVLITDNVIAASVVISSAVKSSTDCKKMVFHVITDRKTYTVMHAWFAVNSIGSGVVVEVKGLHQYDWSTQVNIQVKEMLEIHRQIWSHKIENSKQGKEFQINLEFLNPTLVSLLNHLRIYMTKLFRNLDKILFLDDDIVVQDDLTPLWKMDLKGKVVGAVVDSWCGDGCCPGRKYKNYFNFRNSIISSKLNKDECGWLYGMNIFDLHAWRKTNITTVYHHWLKTNKKSNYTLWKPGALPPALLAFEGHVHPINSSWHIAGLGHRSSKSHKIIPETAAVVHFSGPAKPWLQIAPPQVQRLWYKHVNYSNGFIHHCGFAAHK